MTWPHTKPWARAWSRSWPSISPVTDELRWTHEAAADLERIADYLFEHTPGHAERLVRA